MAATNLKKCYDIAPPRIQQYLHAEINHILKKINPHNLTLELGCGYGRIIPEISKQAKFIIGIDTSLSSLLLAKEMLGNITNYALFQMNAIKLGFRNNSFDGVICIQNGISAFHVDPKALIKESIRITRPGGTILFSSYSEKFWKDRLEWFQLQAEAGLLGEIDYSRTGNGIIICKDGFEATTFKKEQFLSLTSGFGVKATIEEVDRSSLFCEIILPK